MSETILNNIRVLAIDQAIEEKNGQKVVVGKTATLELGPRQAETLALARQLGTLSLALRSIADGGKADRRKVRAARHRHQYRPLRRDDHDDAEMSGHEGESRDAAHQLDAVGVPNGAGGPAQRKLA